MGNRLEMVPPGNHEALRADRCVGEKRGLRAVSNEVRGRKMSNHVSQVDAKKEHHN